MGVEEDVRNIRKNLEKYEDNIDLLTSASTLDMLKSLRDMDITVDMLKSTRIGVTVAKVKKHAPNKSESFKIARDLVASWKKTVDKAKNDAKSNHTSKNSNGSKDKTALSSSSTPSSSSKKSSAYNNASANANNATENNINPSQAFAALAENRKKMATLFLSTLETSKNTSKESPLSVAIGIEAAIHAKYPINTNAKEYQKKVKHLVGSLKKNERLRQALLDGDETPSEIICADLNKLLTAEQWAAKNKNRQEAADERNEDWLQDNIEAVESVLGLEKVTGLYSCEECGSVHTRFVQAATRSGDVMGTCTVNCLDCGHVYNYD